MIITGLLGALTHSQYKWGYFVFGCIAMFMVFYTLIVSARKAALSLGEDVHKAYVRSAFTLLFLWTLCAYNREKAANLYRPGRMGPR